METINAVTPQSPRLPKTGRSRIAALVTAAMLHAISGAAVLTAAIATRDRPPARVALNARSATPPVDVTRLVFLAPTRPSLAETGGGGGGGGNGQTAPIRHASGIGNDAITLRTRKPPRVAESSEAMAAPEPPDQLPAVVLDARPLASGTFDQVGLPVGGVSYGTSTGPGSGGGVGEGVGTGIGSGTGPGIGPGEGGGIGGGVYRPGGSVTAPRILSQVQPTYTTDALQRHLQGQVVLEIIVRSDGCASDIRVVRSLDPGGLDVEAMRAVGQWRFEPGRLHGTPVDVVATVVLDFTIR